MAKSRSSKHTDVDSCDDIDNMMLEQLKKIKRYFRKKIKSF